MQWMTCRSHIRSDRGWPALVQPIRQKEWNVSQAIYRIAVAFPQSILTTWKCDNLLLFEKKSKCMSFSFSRTNASSHSMLSTTMVREAAILKVISLTQKQHCFRYEMDQTILKSLSMEMLSEWGILAMWISNATGLMPKIEKHLKRWNLNIIATWAWLKVSCAIILLLFLYYLLSKKAHNVNCYSYEVHNCSFFWNLQLHCRISKIPLHCEILLFGKRVQRIVLPCAFHIEQRYFSMFAFQSEQNPNALFVWRRVSLSLSFCSFCNDSKIPFLCR